MKSYVMIDICELLERRDAEAARRARFWQFVHFVQALGCLALWLYIWMEWIVPA